MKVSLSLAFVELLDGAGFALLGESLFSVAKKVTKNACPCIRPRLRRGSFAPSPLRGSSYKGHPWPFTTLAASLRLAPLRNDSAHPPERGGWWRLLVRAKRSKAQATPTIFQATRSQFPVRRPSGGVAQGDARQDAERGTKGQGRPFVTAPGAAPEGGNPGVAGAGCRARFLFGYFLFRASKEKVTRPGGRNQVYQHTR